LIILRENVNIYWINASERLLFLPAAPARRPSRAHLVVPEIETTFKRVL